MQVQDCTSQSQWAGHQTGDHAKGCPQVRDAPTTGFAAKFVVQNRVVSSSADCDLSVPVANRWLCCQPPPSAMSSVLLGTVDWQVGWVGHTVQAGGSDVGNAIRPGGPQAQQVCREVFRVPNFQHLTHHHVFPLHIFGAACTIQNPTWSLTPRGMCLAKMIPNGHTGTCPVLSNEHEMT